MDLLIINEIICNNDGHCFSHRDGEITARIKKCTSISNRGNFVAAIHVPGPSQGTGNQKLILYFDEIQNLHGTGGSGNGVDLTGGTGIFIGRRIFSSDTKALELTGTGTKGFIKCNELISENYFALGLNDFNNQITLDINYIEGNLSPGVVYSYSSANPELKNAKIKNLNSSSPSRCIVMQRYNGLTPSFTLNNIKLITSDDNTTEIIYANDYVSGDPVDADIKNYGLFVNKEINQTKIHLKVGDDSNFFYIESVDLN